MQTFELAANSPMGNKFSLGAFTSDLTTSTFWVCLIYGIFINLQNYGIDQNYVLATLSEGCDPQRCCVLADPPRTGMAASLLHEIGQFAPESVLYVSCAPDTLRRDADLLAQYGYRAETAGMLDMFPGTAHFESVTVFRRAS